MAEVSESLKDEMSAALRGDLERARQKRTTEPQAEMKPAPEPEPQPEPERRKSFFSRLRGQH
jgi:hypothetical protein